MKARMPDAGPTHVGCGTSLSGYPENSMAQALKQTGAETVRWNLSDLFTSPDDARIEQTLAREMEHAKAFEAKYKGKVATIEPKGFAAMMRELEDYEKSSAKPEVYAYMLHSENTQDHAAGRLLARVREAGGEVRRQASGAVTEALRGDLRTRGYIFNVILQEKAIDDRLRHFPTWISSRNLANETSDQAVQALVDAVTSRYDMCIRYYRVKRKLLDVGELHEWDRYAPIRDTTRDLTWEEAKELVLGSYYRFSKRAGSLIEEFFKNSWIDAPVVPGKHGGAYCMGVTPDHHPYVLLNFTGKLRDALVMAHELGHGLHDRLAARQNVFDYHPPLTLAETPA